MNTKLSFAAFGLACLLAAPAQAQHHHHMHGQTAAANATANAEGVVKKVDKAAGKMTLTHGPLEGLGMPAMTMAFAVKNPAWLDKFKVGERVRFQVEQSGNAMTVTAIEAAK